MIMKLTDKEDTVIIHYGCNDFNKPKRTIFWISCVHYIKGEKVYFYEDGNEVDIIEKFKNFIDDNQEKTFIHWSMNKPNFGFTAIQSQYKLLTGTDTSFSPRKKLDLSEYLKDKYGIEYVKRDGGRLDNIGKLNGFSGIKENIEVKKGNQANNRLELLFSIYQAEMQGKLKVENTLEARNPYPRLFVTGDIYYKFIEYTNTKILDWYLDFSYLKKRLEHEKMIFHTKDNEFMRIVHNEMSLQQLKDNYYEDYKVKNKLVSLNKSCSSQRENNFNKTFDL